MSRSSRPIRTCKSDGGSATADVQMADVQMAEAQMVEMQMAEEEMIEVQRY
jgi:hypothetical protein